MQKYLWWKRYITKLQMVKNYFSMHEISQSKQVIGLWTELEQDITLFKDKRNIEQ